MQFELNPTLDLAQATQDYAVNKKLRVDGILPDAQAQQFSKYILGSVEYCQAFFLDGQYREASVEKWRQITAEERQETMKIVFSEAAKGVGFWYGRRAINDECSIELQAFLAWLNSEPTLSAIRQITGDNTLKSASAQATRFMPGDFLTRHQDVVAEEQRRIAYVINLSPKWHPDWGGLLQFFELSGKPLEAWSPDFNSLSLFDVRHVHSVTSISNFAPHPRVAISGWFRAT